MGKNGATGNSEGLATQPPVFWKAPGSSSGVSAPSQNAVLYPNTTLNATPPDDGFNPQDRNDWMRLAGDVGNHLKAGFYGVASGLAGNAVNSLMGADNHVNIVIDGDRISVMDTDNAGYDPSDGKVREKVSTDGGYTFVESALTEEQIAELLGYGSVKEMKLALVTQRNYIDFMNKGNAYSDKIRHNIASPYQDTHDTVAKITGFAGSFLPGYGDARDVVETVKGQDLTTGEALPFWQRGLTGAAMLVPFVGGATVRTAINGAGDLAKGAAKHGDELMEGAGESIASQLTRAQSRNTNTLKNIVENNLTDGDFSGALADLQGKPIPKPGGGYWDHLAEMKQSYTALKGVKSGLEGSLRNPNLTPEVRAFLQDRLKMTNHYIQKVEYLFKPFGGIE